MNTVSNSCEQIWLLPSTSSIPWNHHHYFSLKAHNLQVIGNSSFLATIPLTRALDVALFLSFTTPTQKAQPSQLFTLTVPCSLTELLPQLPPHRQPHSRICSAPLLHHPQGSSFSAHLSSRITQKRQFKWILWSLERNICPYPGLPGYDTHQFSNEVAVQQPNKFLHIWISLLKIYDLITNWQQ